MITLALRLEHRGQPPRSVLREIRVASKEELKARIMAAIDAINQKPVVHTWTYQIDQAT